MLITKSGDGIIVASMLVINSPNFSGRYIKIRQMNAAMFCVLNIYLNYFLVCLKVNFCVKNVNLMTS